MPGWGHSAGGLAIFCFVALLHPSHQNGVGQEASPGISWARRRHHLEPSWRADWITVLPVKCSIGVQVKWGILIAMDIFPNFVK